ncbi:MAG: hypothetical protein ABI579_02885 [Candidatus Sumerlaeota bacterium]
MIGPKLNARSYAILILAAIALVVGGKLIAQDTATGSQYQGTAEVAAATREVAAATREVAASNAQIAEALRALATSVDNAGKNNGEARMTPVGSDNNAAAMSTRNDNQPAGIQPVIVGSDSAPAAVVTPVPSHSAGSGVFEMDKKK